MKKILLASLTLWLFIGCASSYTQQQRVTQPTISRAEQLANMCQQGDKQSCQTFFIESRVECNNYNSNGCAMLAMIYEQSLGGNSLVFDKISQAEALKNLIFYGTKACMLGNMNACRELEKIKVGLLGQK